MSLSDTAKERLGAAKRLLRNYDDLLKAVVVPKEIPMDTPEQFDIAVWHCGTAACAVGHLMYHPQFNAWGLVAAENGFGPYPVYNACDPGFDSVAEFFEIAYSEAEWLFSMRSYQSNPTPIVVADRIARFLKP